MLRQLRWQCSMVHVLLLMKFSRIEQGKAIPLTNTERDITSHISKHGSFLSLFANTGMNYKHNWTDFAYVWLQCFTDGPPRHCPPPPLFLFGGTSSQFRCLLWYSSYSLSCGRLNCQHDLSLIPQWYIMAVLFSNNLFLSISKLFYKVFGVQECITVWHSLLRRWTLYFCEEHKCIPHCNVCQMIKQCFPIPLSYTAQDAIGTFDLKGQPQFISWL